MKTLIRTSLVFLAFTFTLSPVSADRYWPGKSDDNGFPVDPPPNYRQRSRTIVRQPPTWNTPTPGYTFLPRQVQRSNIVVRVPSIASPYIAANYRASNCSR